MDALPDIGYDVGMQAKGLRRSVLDIAWALAIMAVVLSGIAGARLRAEHGPANALTASLCLSQAPDAGTSSGDDDPSRLSHCDDCPGSLAAALGVGLPKALPFRHATDDASREDLHRRDTALSGGGWPRAPPVLV
jgi:hypothetical protein